VLESYTCDRTDHEWHLEDAAFKDDQYYGTGIMQQRHCHKCLTTEYIQFVSDKDILKDIETPLVKAGFRDGTNLK
jgi:hypothetical protein